jgi:hypothetical protein
VDYDYVPKDLSNPQGPNILIGKVNQHYSANPEGERIYFHKYSKELTDEFLKEAIADPIDGEPVSLLLHHNAAKSPVVVSYQEFTSDEDFDIVFNKVSKPPSPPSALRDIMEEFKKGVDSKKESKENEDSKGHSQYR